MPKPKVLILKAPGTNCDKETAWAISLAGGDPRLHHFSEILEKPKSILNYNLVVFPGGFSYGDYLGSGKVWALMIESKIKEILSASIEKGCFVLGICNGFQVLLKLGFVPGWTREGKPLASLTRNKTGRFECRWLPLEVEKSSVLYRKLSTPNHRLSKSLELPIAHGEGRFVPADKEVLRDLWKNNQVFLRYKNNINGSADSIAGITNKKGNVIGMMPHPERFVTKWQHYNWQAQKELIPLGLEFLKALVKTAKM